MGIYKDTQVMSANLIDSYMNNHQNFGTNKSQNSFVINQIPYSNSYQVPNTTNTLERTPYNDTVSIGNHKIKKRNVLIGLGAVAVATMGIVAGVKFHNANSLEKAQKTFQKVFLRDDISLEETKAMLSRYKEIEKIENKEDYIQALFTEAKKNYGLEHSKISCKIEDLGKHTLGSSDGGGDVLINSNAKRKGMINFIHHELRHTKQNDMMLSSDSDRYIYSLLNRDSSLKSMKKDPMYNEYIKEVTKKMPNATQEEIEDVVLDFLKDKYAKAMVPTLKAKGLGTKTYSDKHKDFVENLFEAKENYTEPNGIMNTVRYYFNFLEKDARFAGENMEKVVKKTKLDN